MARAAASRIDPRALVGAWTTWLHPPRGREPPATRVDVSRGWHHDLACQLAQCQRLRQVARARCDDGVDRTTVRRLLVLRDDATVHAQDVARAVPTWQASGGLREPDVDLCHEMLTIKVPNDQ